MSSLVRFITRSICFKKQLYVCKKPFFSRFFTKEHTAPYHTSIVLRV